MLRQQSVDQGPVVTNPVSPPAHHPQTVSTDQAAVVTPQVRQVPRNRLPQLYLSGWHWVAALGSPFLFGLILLGVQFLPPAFRYSETGAMLDVATLILLPVLLCACTGLYLRNKRVAALNGALMGLFFHLTNSAARWLYLHQIGVHGRLPFHQTQFEWKVVFITMLVGAFISISAASHAQGRQGRRTMHDKDCNR